MSFDCPRNDVGRCRLKNSDCQPAQGICILNGKLQRGDDVEKERKAKKNS
ncbi:MAG: hypothetical protein ACOCUL_02310 [Bacteroidota bacterium]